MTHEQVAEIVDNVSGQLSLNENEKIILSMGIKIGSLNGKSIFDTEKSVPAAFGNKQQESLEALNAFMNSGHSTKATDRDIRETLEDEMYKEDVINL